MRFFDKCKSLDDLRRAYKDALKKYHPDNGGDVEICQAVNAEYAEAFERLKNSRVRFDDSDMEAKESKKWDMEADEKIREQIFNFIHFEGIEIEIIGSWIWIDGLTFPFRDALKNAGFQWSRNRKKWHWSSDPAAHKRYYKNKLSFDEIKSKYGYSSVEIEKVLRLA